MGVQTEHNTSFNLGRRRDTVFKSAGKEKDKILNTFSNKLV
jgi:hypothetical protein